MSPGEDGCVVKEAQVTEGHGGEAVRIGAGFEDDRILGPVEIDLAEPASFGDQGRERGGWLVDDLWLVIGCNGVVEGICAGDLVGLRSLDYGLPLERAERVRVSCDA